MITIPEQIQKDLITDVNNFDVMAVITSASDTFYFSTREQYFEGVYFEDLDLRISALKESINFKSKKVKMSGTSITLNNYAKDGVRFTDRAKYGILNATVEVYLKTGSCETLEECAKLAKLKVTRFDQSPEKVTLQCDEFLSESLHTELPKKEYTLYSEDNDGATLDGKTYEVYNEQRVPILYGHLKEAPAITYIENNGGAIKVIPDRAMLTTEEIGGVKPMDFIDLYSDGGSGSNVTDLVEQDVMTVKLGEGGARVLKTAYRQNNDRLHDIYWDKQFDIYNDYIEFYTDEIYDASPYIRQDVLLVSENSTLKKATNFHNAYAVHTSVSGQIGTKFGRYEAGDLIENQVENSDILSDVACKWGSSADADGQYTIEGGHINEQNLSGEAGDHYIIDNPCMSLEFESMASSSDIYKGKSGIETPSDVNLISFMKITMSAIDHIFAYDSNPRFIACFFPETADHYYDNFTIQPDGSEIDGLYNIDGMGFSSGTLNGVDPTPGDPMTGFLDADDLEKHARTIIDTCPMRLRFDMDLTNDGAIYTDYRHPFNVPTNGPTDNEVNQWRNRGDLITNYTMHDTNSFLINFVPLKDTLEYKTRINLFAEFNGMLLRRTWYQKNAINNKFYLNAKGRCSIQNDMRVRRVQGLPVVYCSPNNKIGPNPDSHQDEEDNIYALLIDYLGNDKLKYTPITDDKKEIMLKFSHNASDTPSEMQGEVNYIYDLEINQMYNFCTGSFSNHTITINGTLYRHSTENEFTDAIDSSDHNAIDVRLVRCLKNQDGSVDEESEEEINNFSNRMDELDFNLPAPNGEESHVIVRFKEDYIYSDVKKLIKRPKNIINSLLSSEFGTSNLVGKNTADANYELNFSIDKPQKTVDVLQNIAQNTNFFYKTSISSSDPTVVGILNSYSEADKTIFVDYIESYKFSKTKIEDLAIKCRVKYGYDYITESFKHVTQEITSPNIEDYKAFYGLATEQVEGDDFLLEHEAPYIQDEPTALLLRNHLHELHKNQHTVVDFKLNLSQGFELEVGDTINFATIGDGDYTSFFSPYGVDIMTLSGLPYLQSLEGEAQAVLPFFVITEINKTMSSVSIKAIQLHALEGAVQAPDPDPDDDDDDEEEPPELIQTPGDVFIDGVPYQETDYDMMLWHCFHPGDANLSEQQLLNGDLNLDGNVDLQDCILFINHIIENMGDSYFLGDLDGDGYVTENDVDLAQGYVDDPVSNPLSLNQIANADIDKSGHVTQDDVELMAGMVKPIPDPEVDPMGDAIIDTQFDLTFGAYSTTYEDGKIIINFLNAGSVNEQNQDIENVLEELQSSNETLIGAIVTFQPVLTGVLESWPHYFWLGAAGNYVVESIEPIGGPPNQIRVTLDAGVLDGTNLENIGPGLGAGDLNDFNVVLSGTPIPIDPDDDGDGFIELLSTKHNHEANGLDDDVGAWGFSTGLQYTPQDSIVTGADNTILPGATWPELIDQAGSWSSSSLLSPASGIYFKLNITYNQDYEEHTAYTPNEDEMEKINRWLMLNGTYFRISGYSDSFLRLSWSTCLNPDGGETQWDYFSAQGAGILQLYPDNAGDPYNITISQSAFILGYSGSISLENYIIFTLSYPVGWDE